MVFCLRSCLVCDATSNRETVMATDFTGTNTEKVDKVVGAVVELRTTVRLCLAAVGFGMPLVIGLLTFVVVQSFGMSAKIDRLGDRIDRVEQRMNAVEQRLSAVEQRLPNKQ